MVATIKFSQFANASLTNTTNRLVGVSAPSGGSNFQVPYPLIWTTAQRPVSPPAGTQGYNSSLGQVEYWNGAMWLQLAAGGSGSVNSGSANELAFYASSGNAVSGFMNAPSSVLITSAGSVPQWSTTLPAALTLPQPVIQGITNGTNPASGVLGQFIFSQVLNGSPTSIPINAPADVTHITLPAGQWFVWGNIQLANGAGAATQMVGWINSASATLPDLSLTTVIANIVGGAGWAAPVPAQRFNLTTSTLIYLSTDISSPSGTMGVAGGIYALRVS